MERKHKTTLLLDEEVWRRFQENVVRLHGARALSGEVERLLRGQDLEAFAVALEEVFPGPSSGLPSLEEVERARPRTAGRSPRLIREARDGRDRRASGLKRRREALSRGRGNGRD